MKSCLRYAHHRYSFSLIFSIEQQKKKYQEFESANSRQGTQAKSEIIVMKSGEQNPLLEARAKVKKGLSAYAVPIHQDIKSNTKENEKDNNGQIVKNKGNSLDDTIDQLKDAFTKNSEISYEKPPSTRIEVS